MNKSVFICENKAEILFYDNHILVAHKNAGVVTQLSTENPFLDSLEGFCKDGIKKLQNKSGNVFLTPVHRLDKPTSGLVLFAKTDKALSRLNKMQRDGLFEKVYIAIVFGRVKQNEFLITETIEKQNFKASLSCAAEAKLCSIKCSVIGRSHNSTCLKIETKTGRYHQIRILLASKGFYILGDAKYGAPVKEETIALHRVLLSFPHPVQKNEITFVSIPNYRYFQEFFSEIKSFFN